MKELCLPIGTHNNHDDNGGGLTKEQFITRLKSLQQDCEGERKGGGGGGGGDGCCDGGGGGGGGCGGGGIS